VCDAAVMPRRDSEIYRQEGNGLWRCAMRRLDELVRPSAEGEQLGITIFAIADLKA
jgi:hypothetical protein